MIRRFLFTALAVIIAGASMSAQTTSDEFKSRYENQVKRVGYSGLGGETILDKWEADYPDAVAPKAGRINYYLGKSRTTVMITSSEARYLGAKPVLSLKDDDGNDVNYFEDIKYDDEIFSRCQTVADEYIRSYPDELRFRFMKISALIDYEKGDPVLAETELNKLVDERGKSWKLDGEPTDEPTFIDAIQEFCFSLYSLGTPAAYGVFYRLSTRMNKLYPKNTAFIDNIGSYWLVSEKNYKKAISFYKKALKLDPEDVAAIRNKKLAEREIEKK